MRKPPAPAAKRGLLQMTGVVVDVLQKVERLPRPARRSRRKPRWSAPAAASTRWRRRGAPGRTPPMAASLGTGPFAEIARRALAAEGAPALAEPRHAD